jgi:hypothetical protein
MLIELLVVLIVVALFSWAIQVLPIQEPIKTIIIVVMVFMLVFWLLRISGLAPRLLG